MPSKRLTPLTSGPLYTLLSPTLLDALAALLPLPTVRSVSCPFRDPAVWRLLIDEQRRRCAVNDAHPQRVFGLAGPDAGLTHVPVAEWGGHVHTPYEGAAPADLFIKPTWRVSFPEYGGADGSLSAVVHGVESPSIGYFCHHLVTHEDWGELGCASRTPLADGWVHYASKRPYLDVPRRWVHTALRGGSYGPTPWSG